ncbi:MAG: (Fe-S)-binding protein [Chloroflexi bacterium]|nr:(Fe-S)-binding protein [Chloroflexota bacterium]
MAEKIIPPPNLTSPQFKSLLAECVHCGLCLQACPTYTIFKKETDSPRGRIQLMQAASQGRIPLNGALQKHLSLCLACRSCETACPSGVKYGELYQTARSALEAARQPGMIERGIRWLALKQMMPHPGRLRFVAWWMILYERLGLQALVRRLNFLPKHLKNMEALLPALSASFPDYSKPAPAIGQKRGTVAFFYGCIQDAFLARVNTATIRVLQRNGYEVHFPTGQTCCGAAQLHAGEEELARQLARKNIDTFLISSPVENGGGTGGGYDAVVNNAGGCGAVLKEYAHLFEHDAAYADKARRFVSQVQDLSEFLVNHLNKPPQGKLPTRVTYSDSCHLRHGQKVVGQPRKLIKAIPGIQFVELETPDRCCGSAGVYNIVQADSANEILDLKMAEVAATGAEILVTTNTGCHLQLDYGARKAKLAPRVQVMHLAELLELSYRAEEER